MSQPLEVDRLTPLRIPQLRMDIVPSNAASPRSCLTQAMMTYHERTQQDDDPNLEQLLAQKLLEGFTLLKRACPVCSTPLVRMEMEDSEELRQPIEMGRNERQEMIDHLASGSFETKCLSPVKGVPFCVSCHAHVVSKAAEVDLLLKQSDDGEYHVNRRGSIFVDTDDVTVKTQASRITLVGDGLESDEKREMPPSGELPRSPFLFEPKNLSLKGQERKVSTVHVPKSSPRDVEEIEVIRFEGTGVLADAALGEKSFDDETEADEINHNDTNQSREEDIQNTALTDEKHIDEQDGVHIIGLVQDADLENSRVRVVGQIAQQVRHDSDAPACDNFTDQRGPGAANLEKDISAGRFLETNECNAVEGHSSFHLANSIEGPGDAAETQNSLVISLGTDSEPNSQNVCSVAETGFIQGSMPIGDDEAGTVNGAQIDSSKKMMPSASVSGELPSVFVGAIPDNISATSIVAHKCIEGLAGGAEAFSEKGEMSHKSGISIETGKQGELTTATNDESCCESSERSQKKECGDLPEYNERRDIATQVLGTRMLQGYSLVEEQCELCEMPLMELEGKVACVVCPVLRKRMVKARHQAELRRRRKEQENARRRLAEQRERLEFELRQKRQFFRSNIPIQRKPYLSEATDFERENGSADISTETKSVSEQTSSGHTEVEAAHCVQIKTSKSSSTEGLAQVNEYDKVTSEKQKINLIGIDIANAEATSEKDKDASPEEGGQGTFLHQDMLPRLPPPPIALNGQENASESQRSLNSAAEAEMGRVQVANGLQERGKATSGVEDVQSPEGQETLRHERMMIASAEARLRKEIEAAVAARIEAELEAKRLADERRSMEEARLLMKLNDDASVRQNEADRPTAGSKSAFEEIKAVGDETFAQTIADAESQVIAEAGSIGRAEAEHYQKETARLMTQESTKNQWDYLRAGARPLLTRRIMTGWTVLHEFCKGSECESLPLIFDGSVKQCVICGGTGTGIDGAYSTVHINNDNGFDADERKKTPHGGGDSAVSSTQLESPRLRSKSKGGTFTPLDKKFGECDSKRSLVSKEIGKLMLKGWVLLDLSCPNCVMPLLTDSEGRDEICVLCGVVGRRPGQDACASSKACSNDSLDEKVDLKPGSPTEDDIPEAGARNKGKNGSAPRRRNENTTLTNRAKTRKSDHRHTTRGMSASTSNSVDNINADVKENGLDNPPMDESVQKTFLDARSAKKPISHEVDDSEEASKASVMQVLHDSGQMILRSVGGASNGRSATTKECTEEDNATLFAPKPAIFTHSFSPMTPLTGQGSNNDNAESQAFDVYDMPGPIITPAAQNMEIATWTPGTIHSEPAGAGLSAARRLTNARDPPAAKGYSTRRDAVDVEGTVAGSEDVGDDKNCFEEADEAEIGNGWKDVNAAISEEICSKLAPSDAIDSVALASNQDQPTKITGQMIKLASDTLMLAIPTNFQVSDEDSVRELIKAAKVRTPPLPWIDTTLRGQGRIQPSPGMTAASLPHVMASPANVRHIRCAKSQSIIAEVKDRTIDNNTVASAPGRVQPSVGMSPCHLPHTLQSPTTYASGYSVSSIGRVQRQRITPEMGCRARNRMRSTPTAEDSLPSPNEETPDMQTIDDRSIPSSHPISAHGQQKADIQPDLEVLERGRKVTEQANVLDTAENRSVTSSHAGVLRMKSLGQSDQIALGNTFDAELYATLSGAPSIGSASIDELLRRIDEAKSQLEVAGRANLANTPTDLRLLIDDLAHAAEQMQRLDEEESMDVDDEVANL